MILLLKSLQLCGQSEKKILAAERTSTSLNLDGFLNEQEWNQAQIGTGFTTLDPVPGLKPKQKTEIKVLYDDDAFYVGAYMEEVSRDSIMTELTQRDNLGNTDAFAILLDTYGNGTDGIILAVGATGVQYDALKSNDGDEDDDWDAVWESAVQLTDHGWYCEIKVPYAAIRFPKSESQSWTINFSRSQKRLNLFSTWSEIDPAVNGVFTQSGTLTNLKNIKPPIRLSISPYLSTYAIRYHDKESDPINSTGYSYSAGMDVKYGITDAFTLDMTLVPDFGQVEADDLVVNLSPFEVQLSEKRPFFTEGLELFSKADIFYTRRIGGTALNYYDAEDGLSDSEIILKNPEIPQLFNATKISGRNSRGLAIGFFNAIEAKTEAVIEDEETGTRRKFVTQPLTNYNVTVLDQNLKNNSFVSLINTNVWRKGAEFYDANVIATEFDLKDKKQNYSINGQAAYSVQDFADQENNAGHSYEINFEKIAGNVNFWTGIEEFSPNYNHNDLGFLKNANERYAEIGLSYSFFDPIWVLNRLNFWVDIENSYLVKPSVYTETWLNFGFWCETKKIWTINMWFNKSTENKDYFEPRTDDFSRYIIRPSFSSAGFYVGSNRNKKFLMQWNGNLYNIAEEDRWGYFIGLSPRYRFSDRLNVSLSWNYDVQNDDTGWIDDGDDGEIYIGQRDRTRIISLMNIAYTLNNKMGLTFRSRHNWTKFVYNSVHELALDGSFPETDFRDDLDFSNSFFSIDCGFNWRFAPGSDLIFVWKNNISGTVEDQSIDFRKRSYIKGVQQLGIFPSQNSLSLRITYYLDQNNYKKWFGR